MVRLVASMAVLYLALKATQWATRPKAGYADKASTWTADLRRGEPWLLIGAILLPTVVFAYGNWWGNRWASRGFAHATDCIGQLTSLDRLQNVYARFRRADIADSAMGYYTLALDLGARLTLDRTRIDAIVVDRKAGYAARYADLARAGDDRLVKAQFAAIDRCLRDDWPHDGLLDP